MATMQQQQQQEQEQDDPIHSCEICGVSGLSDDEIRVHTRRYHVDGKGQCPFCGLNEVRNESELLLHVNQAHLDYLTPDNESMSFIDDRSPSIDSDSLSGECRGGGGGGGEGVAAAAAMNGGQVNGFCNPLMDHQIVRQGNKNHHLQSNLNDIETKMDCTTETGHTGATPKRLNSQEGPCNGSSSGSTPTTNGSAGHGSPMRSQLGLKLKTTAVSSSSTSSRHHKTPVKSPLECPLCNYKSDAPNVLEEHINRAHFDPLSPSVNSINNNNNNCCNGVNNHNNDVDSGHPSMKMNATLGALQCPICVRIFPTISDLELHVNIEHKEILSPSPLNGQAAAAGNNGEAQQQQMNVCPMCECSFENMRLSEMEQHIETHFGKSPQTSKAKVPGNDLDKEAKRLREERDFEMLRAQYGMDNQGNFREQSSAAMQRAVYAGEMSVADYYERQVGLRAAESHGIDDGTSCTKSIVPRIVQLSSQAPGVMKSLVCSAVDHYASNYGDKGWGCGYRNMQMLLSSLLQNTKYNEAIYSAWGNHAPSRTAIPSISRLQLMVEAAWNQGFDVQGAEQLGCKLHNTRKWIGATEIVTVLSWLRINCQLVDFHRPTSADGHPELFNYVLRYFEEPKAFTPPLYLQHQGHSRTIIGIEQKANGMMLLILDPSHKVAALGSNQESMRLIRRGPAAMRAPQYQIVAVKGLLETKEQYQASKVLRSLRIPPDR